MFRRCFHQFNLYDRDFEGTFYLIYQWHKADRLTFLVVFYPCGLVIATPTAIMVAIGQAIKHGVIIRSGEELEKSNLDTTAFDKTGTLTYSKLEVFDIVSFEDTISENMLLTPATSAEAKSEHPLGKAIVAFAKNKQIKLTEYT